MNAGKRLFPMMVLAIAAGCSPASSGQADAGGPERADAITDRTAAGGEPAPAPILPDIDPAVAGKSAPGRKAGKGQKVAVADEPAMPPLPVKPSVVNVPPPAAVPDLPPSAGAANPRPFPEEVTRYMVDRDGCDHFRGEEAYDMERRAFLQENIAQLCTGTDARLARLRERYAQDPAVMAALSAYDDRIEGNASD